MHGVRRKAFRKVIEICNYDSDVIISFTWVCMGLSCPCSARDHSRDIAASVAAAETPQRHHSYPPPHTKPNI